MPATSGGPDLSGEAAAGSLQAATDVTTAGIAASIAADQSIATLPPGQQASFDVTITLPRRRSAGSAHRRGVPARRKFVAAARLLAGHLGRRQPLRARTQAAVQPDGSIAFGDVTRLRRQRRRRRGFHRGAGHRAGRRHRGRARQLQTEVSAVDPNTPGGRWGDLFTNAVSLEAPDVPPTISGTSASQSATDTMQVHSVSLP